MPVSDLLRSRPVAGLLDALAAPHGIDRYTELVNPMWAVRDVRATVVAIHRETEGVDTPPVATLTLRPTATWRGHRAGQHVQVGVDLPGVARRLTRAFSISSAASAPGEEFTLTIRANPDGQVSRYLVEEARPGTVLHLSQAQGEFTLPGSPATPSPHPLLLITGGSGITPAMSMVRTLLRDAYDGRAQRRVVFLHYARGPRDQIFADELARIAAGDNDVRVHLRHGDQTFHELELRRLVPDFRDIETYCCGPAGLVDLVREAYDGSDRLHVEFFRTPTTGIAGEAGGSVELARSGRSVANTGATLLEQAEAAGLQPESGCRMGICLTCTTRKRSGTVRNVVTGAESALPDEDIQVCVSAPVGDCVVDL